MKYRLIVWLAVLGTLTPGPVTAGELVIVGPPALESLSEDEEGDWVPGVLEGVAQATSGELLMVSYLFEVPGGPADGPCVLTLAIPDILGYQSGTAVGPGSQMLVSFDGGLKFVADRASHKQDQVTDQSGVARVTHLRWLFGRPLQPGVRGYVRYRAIKLAPPVEASEQSGVTPVDGNISQEKNP